MAKKKGTPRKRLTDDELKARMKKLPKRRRRINPDTVTLSKLSVKRLCDSLNVEWNGEEL